MADREVTERDFRKPEYWMADPKDYEFRADGKVVRKDRWETGIRSIAVIVGKGRGDFEIDDVVEAVSNYSGAALMGEMIDVLEQWKAAERDGDSEEHMAARNARDVVLAKMRSTK